MGRPRMPNIGWKITQKKRFYILLNMSLYKKTDIVRALLKAGHFKDALTILKTFRFGFNKEEKRSIQIAHETLSGHGDFYRQLGINVDEIIEDTKKCSLTNIYDLIVIKFKCVCL